ncbi:MAG: hypothetical protein MZV65_16055 [Chromatiales bacterium]|nr:hypothetical protein [Chromatiales bacterium]
MLTRDLFNLFVFLEITAIATYGPHRLRRPEGRPARRLQVHDRRRHRQLPVPDRRHLHLPLRRTHLNLDIAAAGAALSEPPGPRRSSSCWRPSSSSSSPSRQTAGPSTSTRPPTPGSPPCCPGPPQRPSSWPSGRCMPLLGPAHLILVAGSGLATFAAGNLVGARQERPGGCSATPPRPRWASVAAVAALTRLTGLGGRRTSPRLVAGGLLLNHLLAKTGLFLLAGAVERRQETAGGPWLGLPLAAAGVLAAALVGLPPFPGFWAKWRLVQALVGLRASGGSSRSVLGGSLLEAFYVFRWLGVRRQGRGTGRRCRPPGNRGDGSRPRGLVFWRLGGALDRIAAASCRIPCSGRPGRRMALLFLLDGTPGWVKGLLSVAAAAAFGAAGLGPAGRPPAGLRPHAPRAAARSSPSRPLPKGGARSGLYPLLSGATLALGADPRGQDSPRVLLRLGNR